MADVEALEAKTEKVGWLHTKTCVTGSRSGIRKAEDIQALANAIAAEPELWIPVLGEGISYHVPDLGKGRKIVHVKEIVAAMANRVMGSKEAGDYEREEIYEAAQNQDYFSLESILFGEVWDEARFLDEYRQRQIDRRREFADKLVKVQKVNVEFTKRQRKDKDGCLKCESVDLTRLLEMFPGMLLTTCRDETIEAFMECEANMPVDENVCTPYSLTVSPKWERRIEAMQGKGRPGAQERDGQRNKRILVKLNGTANEPNQMLFSTRDFEAYYPQNLADDAPEPYTFRLLKELFCGRKLLFIGMDAVGEKDNLHLEAEPWLVRLLDITCANHPVRYAFTENNADSIHRFIDELADKVYRARVNNTQQDIDTVKAAYHITARMQKEAHSDGFNADLICEKFCRLYNRRPVSEISPRESAQLWLKILGAGKDNRTARHWNEKEIEMLAVMANNLADFYDLEKVYCEAMQGKEPEVPAEELLKGMIEERVGEKGLLVYRLLSEYGEGFPSGFFELLAEDAGQLTELKKAAIQLANSGLCIKGRQRKNVHKRMKYADCIMLTAGSNPKADNIVLENMISRAGSYFNDSYFYLSDILCEKSRDDNGMNHMKKGFERLCRRLCDILEYKSEGYNRYRSLLETEMPVILKKLTEFDYEEMNWKPKLIYYLFRESRLVPHRGHEDRQSDTDIAGELNELLVKLNDILKADSENEKILCDKMMLIQSVCILESQSFEESIQKKALIRCEEAMNIYKGIVKNGIEKEKVFAQGIQIHFLMSRIFGRLSTIKEIERCRERKDSSPEQKDMLDKMKMKLDDAENMLKKRNTELGIRYEETEAQLAHQKGEYYFKMSQYAWENRKYKDRDYAEPSPKEKRYYEEADREYDKALAYYGRYPYQFILQRADVMRAKADLLCQKCKSLGMVKMEDSYYRMLFKAYELYRSNADLHGIADVLQSMGNAENYKMFDEAAEADKRSSFCFYNAAEELYGYLGDEWSWQVTEEFRKGALKSRSKL